MQAFWQKVAEILLLSKLEKRWQKVARALAIVVVFWTTYMLILPAITMDNQTYCGMTEHSHTYSCYSVENELTCELTEHQHEEFCFIKELATGGNVTDGNVTDGNASEHIHNSKCYTKDDILACTEWGKEEPWGLDRESEEFKEKAVQYVTYLINQLPDIDEFENKLDRLDQAEDYEGYEEYYKEVYAIATRALVNYENLGPELCEEVPNKTDFFEYEWLYSVGNSYAVTETRTVEFVNYYDSATAYKSVLIHSGNVGDYSGFGFWYWYAVVVDENEYGDLVVTAKYDYDLHDKSDLKPSTSKGFVLLSHGDSNTFDCEIGDEATVNFDYLNTSGKNTSSFGTVTFSDYYIPVDVEEDEPIVIEKPSDTQVNDAGGTVTSADKNVVVSKKLKGTELENVFDITLTVQTKTNVQTFLSEPDMAVVIVMDISNTMNSIFTDDTMSRYDAAVTAASNFINQFAENTAGLSKIGFVAFNTSAHEIFALQPCSTADQASSLISEMSSETDSIISASGYGSARTRYTNVEGGLKRAYDMLEASGNSNQYVILLTDGFPTTYLKDNSPDSTDYSGYEPYTESGTVGTDGVFYDSVLKTYCKYGTSYSDKASIKAREMATYIKSQDAKIFSVGVDIAGQTVQQHINNSSSSNSIVDRTGTTYEIGGANDLNAYKNWLGNSIGSGSGYYYDSTDQEGITTAFNNIFQEILELNGQTTKTVWTATDPLPVLDDGNRTVEFIYFYDKDGNVSENPDVLTGEFTEGAEDTANHTDGIIFWDLKKSGYTTSVDPDDPNTTYYFYSVKYRVRLQNENSGFVEGTVYPTNGNAFLEYRTIVTSDGVQNISESRSVYFPKPAVNGYLSEFSFTKTNNMGSVLPDAEFTLFHDMTACAICQGDGTSVVDVTKFVEVSNENGTVSFTDIPSGHFYYMKETVVPEGYISNGSTYVVDVAYNEITIIEYLSDGTQKVWSGINDKVVNLIEGHILPETGGFGTHYLYIIGGLLIILSSVFLLCLYKKRQRKEGRRLRE
ncbi:MAG: VWA domain-containing protein [Clostridia bacterium]|nr:VWA domain-containing protein [Clostridia bacterium]